MPDTRIVMRFARLNRLLRSSDLDPEAREAHINAEVQVILEKLPSQEEEDQQDIRAALHHLGLLSERRSGEDRREQARAASALAGDNGGDRRANRDRRQPRDLSDWLPKA
jgi:hypothetical protein